MKRLPADQCPFCGRPGHVPGLPCPECFHCHEVSWAILQDTEFGYEVVALNDRRQVLARFEVGGI
ncbi:hypothetical protein OH491_03690 [Termitidicoccus mucosus]|uniref:hypothetical protein n=1 Tax=Termitidicoccus mucosus TaxID=1184151 RepID=UPI0011AB4BBA